MTPQEIKAAHSDVVTALQKAKTLDAAALDAACRLLRAALAAEEGRHVVAERAFLQSYKIETDGYDYDRRLHNNPRITVDMAVDAHPYGNVVFNLPEGNPAMKAATRPTNCQDIAWRLVLERVG